MARVFKARDVKLGRLVAIKQMAPDLEQDKEAVSAFEREARILANVSDPNVVKVYDSIIDEGHYYFVMEYIEGEHLGKLIRRGPTPVEQVVRILEQVLSGLQTMHGNGIIHQDIKPSNILIDSKGVPKITDFGLATSAGEDGPTLDWGSVQYLAPEVFSNTFVQDARLDIYALGMVAFELLLGEKAFRAECPEIYENESEISRKWVNWHQNQQQQFRPLSEINPEIPLHLSQIVARMMAKDRLKRYGNVTSVLQDLKDKRQQQEEEEVEDDPSKTRPLGDLKKKAAPVNQPAAQRPAQKKSSRTLLYVGGAVSILVFLFLLLAPPRNQLVAGSVSSNAGAELTIDNRKWGIIPASGVMRGKLAQGNHTAKLVLKDYETVETSFEVTPSQAWSVDATLKSTLPSPPPVPVVPEVPTRLDLPSGAMLLIPAGEFQYGADKKRATLPAFYMDETEVTNAAYRKFCEATSHTPPPNPPWDPDYFRAKDRYPVLNVTWDDAVAFAQWAGKRLPTELEWEKAARGTDGRTWPWGSEFDPKKANLGGDKDGFVYTAPVGSFPAGASPYGMLDMAGNVWEWVADAYGPTKDFGPNDRVLKGGAFVASVGKDEATTFFHGRRPRTERPNGVGFRCAKDAPAPAPPAATPTATPTTTPPAAAKSPQQ
jgi:serine/threonine-protein kinase